LLIVSTKFIFSDEELINTLFILPALPTNLLLLPRLVSAFVGCDPRAVFGGGHFRVGVHAQATR
jgi:hypothetical protein